MKRIGLILMSLFVCLQMTLQSQTLSENEKQKNKQTKFFNEKMEELGVRNPLNEKEKSEILNYFLEQVKTTPEKGAKKLYYIAVSKYVNDTAKLYCLYKDEFESSLSTKYKEAIERQKVLYNLNDKQIELLSAPIYLQVRETLFNYYLFPEDRTERAKRDNEVKNSYKGYFEFAKLYLGQNILTKQEEQNILNSYLELAQQSPEKGKKLYHIAVSRHINDTAKLYSLFKDEFESTLNTRYKEALERQRIQLSLTDMQMNFLAIPIYQQVRRAIFNYYLFPDNETERANKDNEGRSSYKGYFEFAKLHSGQNILTSQEEQKVLNSFLELSQQSPEKSKRDLYQFAVCSQVSDTAKIYKIFKNEIDYNTELKYKEGLSDYKNKYKLAEREINLISKYLKKRAHRIALNNYKNIDNEENKKKVNEGLRKFYDKKIEFTLTMLGVNTNLSKYCSTLKLKKPLSLSAGQINDIVVAGQELFQNSKKEKGFNLREEEHKAIKGILNADQYEKYLAYRVANKVREDAQMVWNEAEQLGITVEMDSASVFNQILVYKQERAKIREKYKIISDSQKERDEQLNILHERQPNVLRKISSLKKRDRAAKRQDDNTLVW